MTHPPTEFAPPWVKICRQKKIPLRRSLLRNIKKVPKKVVKPRKWGTPPNPPPPLKFQKSREGKTFTLPKKSTLTYAISSGRVLLRSAMIDCKSGKRKCRDLVGKKRMLDRLKTG